MEGGGAVINANKGTVIIEGETVEVLAEFTGIIRGIKDLLTENYSEETADKLIARAGQVAFSDEIITEIKRIEK